ncbi:hypothetical protein BKH46_08030 [Helicobacter sp. 12S02634-8]|uniref:AAA family ATPase n=1 Tax=Helicobacter sp. 12S02634-8 TaxID=1476199 RepID=UPI000BA53B60|nr:AAA family ATPase [Helicobacter sp. 12S02634-8]PAF46325.1 hypothetical protein BKH46_08030 [Helicobacter sp. 12S02634-8]
MSYKKRVREAIAEIEDKLIEREELIRLCFLCIFSKQHMFLIGTPGVGKTYAIQIISKVISDGSYWEKLLSKETLEKDLIGREDTPREETLLAHHFIFLDEMFKATDDLLVSLLSFLNERYYTIKGKAVPVPLYTLFSASNELPFGEKIEPFSDRLLIWFEVNRIQKKENKERFIRGAFNKDKSIKNTFLLSDIEDVCKRAKAVAIPDEISDTYFQIQDSLIRSGIKASDRKFGSDYVIKALRVSAVLNDREALDFSDLLFVRHMSWTNYLERNKLAEVVDNVIFGDREKIESSLIKVNEFFSKKNSSFDRSCFKFINYQLQISDRETYKENIDLCSLFLKDMGLARSELNKTINQYNKFLQIKKQEKENILLCPSMFSPFTQESIELMNATLVSVDFQIKKVQDFIDANPDLYAYQRNQNQKGVKTNA